MRKKMNGMEYSCHRIHCVFVCFFQFAIFPLVTLLSTCRFVRKVAQNIVMAKDVWVMSHLLQVAICSAFAIFECKVCVFFFFEFTYIFQYYHCSLNIHSAYGSYKRSYRLFGNFKHNLLCTSVKCANVNLTLCTICLLLIFTLILFSKFIIFFSIRCADDKIRSLCVFFLSFSV